MSHVLILHEDPSYSRSICRLLKRNDIKASIAQDRHHIVDDIKQFGCNSEKVDVIITDSSVGSHVESRRTNLLKALKREAIDIPVIVITGCTHADNVSKQTDHAVYIKEPIEEQVLLDKLARVLAS